jgi:hypothetical protein
MPVAIRLGRRRGRIAERVAQARRNQREMASRCGSRGAEVSFAERRGSSLEDLGERQIRQPAAAVEAVSGQDGEAEAARRFAQLGAELRLPEPGFCADGDDVAAAGARAFEPAEQSVEFTLAADEGGGRRLDHFHHVAPSAKRCANYTLVTAEIVPAAGARR